MKEKSLKFYFGSVRKRYLVYGYFENISNGLWAFTPQYFKAMAVGTSTEVNIYLITMATSAVNAFLNQRVCESLTERIMVLILVLRKLLKKLVPPKFKLFRKIVCTLEQGVS